ncbi:hypothetical protein Tco_0588645 [Tanacetum coccineum]
MGTFIYIPVEETEGALQPGPERLSSRRQRYGIRCPWKDTMQIINEDHIKRNNARGNVGARNAGGQNKVGNENQVNQTLMRWEDPTKKDLALNVDPFL